MKTPKFKIATIAMAAALLPMAVLSNVVEINGINWTYAVANGKVSLGILADTAEATQSAVPASTAGKIEVPAQIDGMPVEKIDKWAFHHCKNLTEITIPPGVTTICNGAFYGCTHLGRIALPGTVTTIEDYAFRGCTRLNTLSIPNSVTNIGFGVFSGCPSISTLTMPPRWRLAQIFPGSFKNMTTVNIPEGCTEIAPLTYKGCINLAHVNAPSTLKHVGDEAFYGCISLWDISIPDHRVTYGRDCFVDVPGRKPNGK